MNGTFQICVTLLLLAMTVSTGIFATESKDFKGVKGFKASKAFKDSGDVKRADTLYSYTAAEARQIAVLLAKGEKCDSLLAIADRQVELLDSIRIRYASLERNLSTVQQQADTLVSELAERNRVLQKETEKLRKKERCKNRLVGGSVLLNVLLIVLLAF
jgi:hypothetical protein